MLEPRPVAEHSARRERVLKWLGRGYLTYHALVVAVLLVLFFVDTRPGSSAQMFDSRAARKAMFE